MATDIATLGIQIDTSALDRASQSLQNFADAAARAQSASERMQGSTRNAATATDRHNASLRDSLNIQSQIERSLMSVTAKLAGLAAGYVSLEKAMSFLKRGVDFNSSIEQARIGMASLITSMTKLSDAQGKALEGMEKYKAAQVVAKDLMQEIQKLGLETTATTQELVEGVQSIMGPALQAGMALKDIPKFAVQGAQAMQTLGVPLNQMRTELEALLSGNINKAQDILAPKLFADINGDLGKYIKGLKESGTLIDEIMNRLEPFRLAGEDVAKTWAGLTSNLEEAFDVLAGQTANNLSESLKKSVTLVSELVLTTKEGAVGISQDFQGIAEVIAGIESSIGRGIVSSVETLTDWVRQLGKYINEIGADNFLANMNQAALTAAAGIAALTAARKAQTAQFVIANGVEQQSVTGLGNYAKALAQSEAALRAERTAAQQALATAQQRVAAYKQQAAAIVAYMEANHGAMAAEAARANTSAVLNERINAATAAEARYTAAVNASSVALRASNALKKAGSALLAMLGGPLGAAFTAAAAGAMYLATTQSEAEKGANLYNSALKTQEELSRKAAEAGKTLASSLNEVDEAQRRIAKSDAVSSLEHFITEIKLLDFSTAIGGWFGASEQFSESAQALDEMAEKVQKNEMSFKAFEQELANVYVKLDNAGEASSSFGERIKEALDLAKQGTAAEEVIAKLTGNVQELGNAANDTQIQVQGLKEELAGGWSIDTSSFDKFMKSAQESIAKSKLQIAGLKDSLSFAKIFKDADADTLKKALDATRKGGVVQGVKALGDAFYGMDLDTRKNMMQALKVESERLALYEKAQSVIKADSASATRSAETAARKAANAQIEYKGSIDKTTESIKALESQLALDQTEDLTKKKVEITEKYKQSLLDIDEEYKKSLNNKGVSQQQALELKQLKEKEALLKKNVQERQLEEKQTQKNVQIAQGQIKFYKELGQLSGNYADTVDLQNLLLQKQADEYRNIYGISEDLVQKWLYYQQLQNSQDPFDGAYRGLLKFQAEYADSAKEWESITYNFGKSFMSTTRSMFDDFLETGKASFDSFQNLFRQLLKDLAWQAIAQPIMLSVIGGVTGTFTGGGTAQAGTTAAGGSGAASSGGASGLVSQGASLAGKYAMNQLMGGSGGLMGTITSGINSAVANMFPSMFASSARQAAFNAVSNSMGAAEAGIAEMLPTTTFTSSLGTAAIGAGIGAIASPFVNSLLGLENNTGSQVGSMVGGGLGTLGGAMLAATAIPGAGWIAGGLAALGSLLGGGIGSLFGGGKKELPELYLNVGANLWENAGALAQTPAGGAALFNTGDDYFRDSFARVQGAQGTAYSTAQEVAEYLAGIIQSGQDMSAAIADALGSLDKNLKSDYLAQLQEKGRIDSALYLEGENITTDRIESFGSAMADLMQEAMLESLANLDLRPLVTAADGKFADTAEELGKALGNLISYASLGASIDDEEMRARFNESVIPRMTDALANVSLAPLAKNAEGFAVKTVGELSTALTDVFSVYDVSASIDDENIRASFQQWAQNAIEQAFTGLDLSFLRVDFDQNDFAGLQQAYAAIQAWETVQDNIEAVINPATEFTSQLTAASDQFDAWIANLKALGWQEEAVAEVEAKRATYMRKLANSISQEFAAFMQPASQFEQAMQAGADQFDDWISNLQRLGYAEEEIIAIEGRRAEYLEQLRASLERSTAQDASSRLAALRYGSSSSQYALQSLLFQQANERESLKSQFGENHYLYQTVAGIQKAELASTLLGQLQAEREKLLQKEQQAAQERISAEQAALQERSSAIQGEISAANSLANTFRRIVKTLEEYRRDLWSGENNLTGSRYEDTYRQFNELYEKALQGDEDAFNEITGKANELLALGREQLPERGEYNDLFYDVDQKLKLTQIKSEQQLGAAEKQAGLLNNQLAALQGQQNTLNSQLEALQKGNETEEESLLTLGQIDLGIAALQALIAAQTEEARKTYAQGATTSWDWDRLLQEKAESLNSGATWQPGYATSGWTAEKVLENMLEQGLTPQTWYEKYGKDEGFVLKAAESVTGALDSSLSSLDGNLKYYLANNAKLLDSSLDDQLKEALAQGISLDTLNGIEGSYWPKLLENMLGLKTGLDTLDSSFLSFAQKLGTSASGTTGIYGSNYATEAELLAAKVEKLNQDKYQGRSDWSVTEVKKIMEEEAGSVQEWYEKYGKDEGFGSSASGSTSSGGSTGTTTKPSTGGSTSSGSTSGNTGSTATTTGIYGSKYATEAALVNAKVGQLNRNKFEGRNTWTNSEVRERMIKDFGSIEDWYINAGKAEGFAKGGITPANRLIMVGEEGPELMMLPRQYGVLSNEATEALLERDRPRLPDMPRKGDDQEIVSLRQQIAVMTNYIRQIVVKTDKIAYESGKMRTTLDEWNQEGLPEAAQA